MEFVVMGLVALAVVAAYTYMGVRALKAHAEFTEHVLGVISKLESDPCPYCSKDTDADI